MYILNDAVVVAIAAVYITFIRCMYACGELIINFRLIRPRLILHLLLSHMALPVDELKNSKKKAFTASGSRRNCRRVAISAMSILHLACHSAENYVNKEGTRHPVWGYQPAWLQSAILAKTFIRLFSS